MNAFQENIKDFVLNDPERFGIAVDVYESFGGIVDFMLKDVLVDMIESVKTKHNLPKLGLVDFGRQANNYWFRVELTDHYMLTMYSWKYFKTFELFLRDKDQGYDPNDGRHNKLREVIGAEQDFSVKAHENWFIVAIKNSKYELDIGGDYLDLFQVYDKRNGKSLRGRLCQNFSEKIGGTIARISQIVHEFG